MRGAFLAGSILRPKGNSPDRKKIAKKKNLVSLEINCRAFTITLYHVVVRVVDATNKWLLFR